MAIDEEQIRNWLMEEDLIREKIYDENANFHYIINFPNNNSMDIIQPRAKEDVLLIGCATEVSQDEQNIIKNSPKNINQEFIWKIRFALNEMLLDFELEHPNDQLKRFIITEDIFEDALTKHMLIKSLAFLSLRTMTLRAGLGIYANNAGILSKYILLVLSVFVNKNVERSQHRANGIQKPGLMLKNDFEQIKNNASMLTT